MLRAVECVVARVRGEEVPDERDSVDDPKGERSERQELQIGSVEPVVINHRPARAEFEAANLAQVNESEILLIRGLTAVAKAVDGLAHNRGSESVTGKDARLARPVLVPTRLRDNILDASLAEDEGRGVLGDKDLRAVRNDISRALEVRPTPVIGLLIDARSDHRVLIEVPGGNDVLPLIRESAAESTSERLNDSHR